MPRLARNKSVSKYDKKTEKGLPETFVLDLFSLEMDVEKEIVPIASLQKLLKLYKQASEYYESKKDIKSLIFKNKMTNILLKENCIKAINKEHEKKQKDIQKLNKQNQQINNQVQASLKKLKSIETKYKLEQMKEQSASARKPSEKQEKENIFERSVKKRSKSAHNTRLSRTASENLDSTTDELNSSSDISICSKSVLSESSNFFLNVDQIKRKQRQQSGETKEKKKLNFNAKSFTLNNGDKLDNFMQKKAAENKQGLDVSFELKNYLKTGKKPTKSNNNRYKQRKNSNKFVKKQEVESI